MENFQFYAVFITLFFLFYSWYIIKRLFMIKKNLPPSPPALPVIGNLHQLGKMPHRSLQELSKKYGPLMLVHLGSMPTLIVSSPDVAREIFKRHDLAFSDKYALGAIRKLFYDSKDLINLPYGDQWRKLRGIFVHEVLSSTRVKSFDYIRDEEMALLLQRLKQSCLSGSRINLTNTFMALMNDLICRAAFGKKHSETQIGRAFLGTIEEAVGLMFTFRIGEVVPWLAWINELNGFNAALDRCSAQRDELLDAVIEERLNHKGGGDDNFVDTLLDIYNSKIPGVSIDLTTVKGVILDIFGAGTETSAITLTWAMTELIRHPTTMKKLQDEVREVMKGKHHMSDDVLQKLPYLKAVVKETLRLHPPVAINFRAVREHAKLMGYDIQPKTLVLLNIWALGRDSSSWHKPEKFMPERFMNSSMDFKGLDFSFLPFGAGRRICPGIAFATTSIEHILANVVHNFDWALPDGGRGEDLNVNEKPGFTIRRKDPLVVVATKCYF